MSGRRRGRRMLGGVVRGSLIGLLFVVVAPVAAGWRTMTVMSGSMAPTIATGDAVVSKPVAASSLRPGDVATFTDPAGTGRLITHRVLSVEATKTKVHVTTRGDANNTSESWDVAADGRVGRVLYRVPRVGYLLVPASSPFGRLLLVGLPVVLLGALALVRVWRTERPQPLPPTLALALPPGPSGHGSP